MNDPSFIDLHCHPGLKSFLTANTESERENCWKYLNAKWLFGLVDRFLLDHMLDSASSLSQLVRGNVSVAVVGLYSYEKAMIKGRLAKIFGFVLNLLNLSRILNRLRIREINYEVMQRISEDNSNYFKLFKELRKHLLNSETITPGYNLPGTFTDIQWDMHNIILSIEGGHNLCSRMPHTNSRNAQVMRNLDKLKYGGLRYFFFSPAHLESNPLCTHAYGMKMISDERFLPDGEAHGIGQLGKAVIKKALEEPNRILIDIKHMSLVSRRQYYKMVERGIPIIMSHGGVTGVSYNSMPIVKCELTGKCAKVEYFKPAGLMNTNFNPWSINLYDEEIPIILESDGIIGLNLDERILGTKQRKSSELFEYFSRRDFLDLWDQVPANDDIFNDNQANHRSRRRRLFVFHRDVKHLCNNILHIVKIGGREAWDHICIGSDFDGMVNAIDPYDNSVKLKKLRRHLIKHLPLMAESDPGFNYHIHDIQRRVDGIMSENAKNFLKKYF
ncbi:MAG: membrane dipeptidase [Bacteroidales bacterium]|nr:membrane dipeptidase [Bacteroidales bacterium]